MYYNKLYNHIIMIVQQNTQDLHGVLFHIIILNEVYTVPQ